jgi:hypothetical protein
VDLSGGTEFTVYVSRGENGLYRARRAVPFLRGFRDGQEVCFQGSYGFPPDPELILIDGMGGPLWPKSLSLKGRIVGVNSVCASHAPVYGEQAIYVPKCEKKDFKRTWGAPLKPRVRDHFFDALGPILGGSSTGLTSMEKIDARVTEICTLAAQVLSEHELREAVYEQRAGEISPFALCANSASDDWCEADVDFCSATVREGTLKHLALDSGGRTGWIINLFEDACKEAPSLRGNLYEYCF